MTSNPSELAGAKENVKVRWRNQGGKDRAYAVLRFLGGGQPALIPPGEKRAGMPAACRIPAPHTSQPECNLDSHYLLPTHLSGLPLP
jgi:hypothetical protein